MYVNQPSTPSPRPGAPRLLWIGEEPGASWQAALGHFQIHWVPSWDQSSGCDLQGHRGVIVQGGADRVAQISREILQTRSLPLIAALREPSEAAEIALLNAGSDVVLSERASEGLIRARLRAILREIEPEPLPASPTPVEAKTQQYNQRLMALTQASKLLTTMDDQEVIFQGLVELVSHELKSRRVSIMSVDREAGVLQMTAAVGIPDHIIRQARTPIGEGIAGTCAALGKPLFIDDHMAARGSSDLQQYVPAEKAGEPMPMSLTVPLKMKGEVIGVVNVTERLDNKPYSKTDISFIQALLGQAGFLMENNRLMSHLRSLKAFNDQVIDTLWDPLCVFDIDGQIVRPNERFVQIFGDPQPGITLAEHIGMDNEIECRLSGEITGAEMEGGRRHLGEWSLQDRVFEVTLAPFAHPTRSHFLLFLHDLTGKRNMERRLVAAEKMASLGVLAAGVAHEINNPLAFVKANTRRSEEYFSDLLSVIEAWHTAAAKIDDPAAFMGPRAVEREIDLSFLTEDVELMVKESIEGVERVEKIVLGLKSFAHPDTETVHRVHVSTLIDNAVMLTKGKWKYSLEVVTEIEKLPEIWCLPNQLEQVFMNLIVNAAQATEEWGRLVIGAQLVRCGVEITFRDEGKGIPEEVRRRIFEPFFTTKDIGEGTGMGLAIAYNILENHGGNIAVESELGRGTTFKLWLPLGQEERPIVVEQGSRFRI